MYHGISVCGQPDRVIIQTSAVPLCADRAGDCWWESRRTVLRTTLHADALSVMLASTDAPVKCIWLRWGGKLPPLRILGDDWERAYGDLEWRGFVPERVLPWYFLAWDGKRAAGCGVMTGPNAMCSWRVDERGITLCINTQCGAEGFQPHSPVELCKIREMEDVEGETAFEAANRLCAMLCPNPLTPKTPVYGGNNWYYAYGKSSHAEILDDAKRIAGLAPDGINRPFMVIDAGWQQYQHIECDGGHWDRSNDRFPNMPGLATEMKHLGVKPGIWVRPLLTHDNVPGNWLLSDSRFPGKVRRACAGPKRAGGARNGQRDFPESGGMGVCADQA